MTQSLVLFLAIVITIWYLIKEVPAGAPPGRRQRLARIGLLVVTPAVLVLSLAGVHGHFGR